MTNTLFEKLHRVVSTLEEEVFTLPEEDIIPIIETAVGEIPHNTQLEITIMSTFDQIKSRAQADLETLKTDAQDVGAKVEAAFKLAFVHQQIDTIINDASSVEEKVLAAFRLGQ